MCSARRSSAIDLQTRKEIRRSASTPSRTLRCSPRDGKTLFVSLWGGAKVLMFAADTLEPLGEVAVGAHPNAMVLSKDGRRLFVACANTNAVWVIDLAARAAKEQISVALYPRRAGRHHAEQPGAVAGRRHDARGERRQQQRRGGRYREARCEPGRRLGPGRLVSDVGHCSRPTGARFFVLDGKGLTSEPNLRGTAARRRALEGRYTGNMLQGALSIIPTPDRAALPAMTRRVYELTPYTDAHAARAGRRAGRQSDPAAAWAARRRSSTSST